MLPSNQTRRLKGAFFSIAGSSNLVIADSNEPRTIDGINAYGVNINKVDKYPGCVVDRIRTLTEFTWVVTPESYNAKI